MSFLLKQHKIQPFFFRDINQLLIHSSSWMRSWLTSLKKRRLFFLSWLQCNFSQSFQLKHWIVETFLPHTGSSGVPVAGESRLDPRCMILKAFYGPFVIHQPTLLLHSYKLWKYGLSSFQGGDTINVLKKIYCIL